MRTRPETQRGFTLTRTLDAPRHLVFQAWTDPDHLQWFFNPEMTPPGERAEVDLRVGGAWRQRMVINEHVDYVTGGIYREIVPVERLVFEWGAVGGWPEIDADRRGDELVVTVELAEVGQKTEMVLRLDFPAGLTDAEVRKLLETGMDRGWGDTIDRLVAAFAGGHIELSK
jgi:uncharacterized protein YndB with AHSA1/START domain